jgi:hypothetical protein
MDLNVIIQVLSQKVETSVNRVAVREEEEGKKIRKRRLKKGLL